MNETTSSMWRDLRAVTSSVLRNELGRNSTLVFANSAVIAAGGLVFWALAARQYSPQLVGVAASATSLVLLLATLSQLGLGTGMIRYSAGLGPNPTNSLARVFGLTLVTALGLSLLAVGLVSEVVPSLTPTFVGLGTVYFIGATCTWTLFVQFNSYLISRRLTGLLAVSSVLVATVRVFLLLVSGDPSPSVIVAITGAAGFVGVIGVLPSALAHLNRSPIPVGAVATRKLLAYSLWNHASTLASTTAALIMPSLVLALAGPSEAAAYFMAWSLYAGLLMIPSAIAQSTLAVQSAKGLTHVPAVMNTRSASLLWLLLLGGFTAFATAVLYLLGPEYLEFGLPAILILGAGFWVNCRVLLLQTEMRLRGSQRDLALAYLTCHVLVICASVPLLIFAGPVGAAGAWTTGQLLLFVWLRSAAATTTRGRT